MKLFKIIIYTSLGSIHSQITLKFLYNDHLIFLLFMVL
jgi:hypothetical protein